MNVAIWIVQGVLALMFLMAGAMKLTQDKAVLSEKLGDWVEGYAGTTIKVIGLLEVLGAIGLVIPMTFDFFPILTPLAAIGLALTMVGAMMVHLKRQEKDKVAANVVLMLLAILVAIYRF